MKVQKSRRAFYDIEVYPNLLSYKFKDYESKELFTFVMYYFPEDTSHNLNQYKELVSFLNKKIQWLIGYNNQFYDDVITKSLLSKVKDYEKADVRLIVNDMHALSQKLIESQRMDKTPPEVYLLRDKSYFHSYDIIQVFNTIDRVGLKQLAINLRWPVVTDLPYTPDTFLNPIECDEVLNYQDNDIGMTEYVFNHIGGIVNSRIAMEKSLGMDVSNKCDTDIAKAVLAKLYEDHSGNPFKSFSDWRTRYSRLNLGECISDKVKFITPKYQKLITVLQKTTIDPNKREDKGAKKKQFEYIHASKYLTHTVALGGIHSNNPPEILIADEKFIYYDIDATSYYPRLLVNENQYPKHLGPEFIPMYRDNIVEKRVIAKREGDKVTAQTLKIAANGTYGLTKSPYSWLYDPKVTQTICITGQLFLLMLMESLELYSDCIVVYSNTDGLTVKVPRNQVELFKRLCRHWEVATDQELEYVEYDRIVIQDVNNYLIFKNGKKSTKHDHIKAKGAYAWIDKIDDVEDLKSIAKGYYFPIVAKAVRDYFDRNIPIEDTIRSCTDIYEFMKAERTSTKKFRVLLYKRTDPINTEPTELQKNNRWIITKNHPDEGKIVKQSLEDNSITEMQKGAMVTIVNTVVEKEDFSEWCIDYQYYIDDAQSMINLKPAEKETHVGEIYEQGLLFT